MSVCACACACPCATLGPDDAIDLKMLVEGSGIGVCWSFGLDLGFIIMIILYHFSSLLVPFTFCSGDWPFLLLIAVHLDVQG
jgi:hypothetical protein